jgi:hypothetical protein
MDDYRKAGLKKAIEKMHGKCTLHGRFLAEERAIAKFALGKYGTMLEDYLIDNSDTAECFYDSAQTLSLHKASLTITDARYQRFGLCPNRYIEAIAVGTLPICQDTVLANCDSQLQVSLSEINKLFDVNYTGDIQLKADVTAEHYENVMLDFRTRFAKQLILELGKLADGVLFTSNKD